MMTRQSQKGGDSSTNIQTEQMIVHVGIDEKRAREVFQEMNLQLKKEYTQEALSVANARVSEFENNLMPKMEQVDGALEAFADPSFQLLLVEAQKTAASTERAEDYELLSELLIHRFKKGEDRIARAGISFAVEIVDKISNEALLGLTITHAVMSFLPLSGHINQGLDTLNDLFGKIISDRLPVGQDWIDHLDLLRAVRLNSLGTMKKIQQYYPEVLPGYVDVGIEKESENYTKAIEILNNNNLPTSLLVDHTFDNNYQRLQVPDRKNIDAIPLQQQLIHEGRLVVVPIKLTGDQVMAINSIYDLYSQDDNLKSNNVNSFMKEWDKRPSLKIIKEWWDNIPVSLTLTSVGKVLAHSNAQRCNKNLPPLN
jgi:hypothetical protein